MNDIEWFPLKFNDEILSSYEISKCGQIKSLFKNIIRKSIVSNGYKRINLVIPEKDDSPKRKIQEYIHRLVAWSFLNFVDGDNLIINHINGDKLDNNSNNLEIITQSENMFHAHRILKVKTYGRKINRYTNKMIFIDSFDSIKECCDQLGYKQSTISACCRLGSRHDTYIFKYEEEISRIKPDCNFSVLAQYPTYEIYENGQIWSNKTNKLLTHEIMNNGYRRVSLTDKKREFVHRLVAMAFVSGQTENRKYVNHKDKNIDNNHFSNLEWCSHSENIKHSNDESSTRYKTNSKALVKKSLDGVIIEEYKSLADASRRNKLNDGSISHACKTKTEYKKYLWEFLSSTF